MLSFFFAGQCYQVPGSGPNPRIPVDAAVRIIGETGFRAFSMRELARTLNVRAASLYNHFASLEELLTAGCLRAELHSMEGLTGMAMAEPLMQVLKEYPLDDAEKAPWLDKLF